MTAPLRTAETLSRIALFASLDQAAAAALDSQCIWRRAKAGEWVLDHKDGGSDVYFVLTGHARVLIRTAEKDVILRDMKDGDFFGELAAIDGEPRSAGIVAVTDTVLARMPDSVFRSVLRAHPKVCDLVLRRLTSEIRRLAARVKEFATLDVRGRLYSELLRLARPRAGQEAGQQAVISPPPTHAELAARIATHREAVTRELKALERAGIIEKRRGALAILDCENLRQRIGIET